MTKKSHIFLLTIFATFLITSCKDYLKFELTRYFSGFFLTLIIGLVGLIIMGLKGGRKNDRK